MKELKKCFQNLVNFNGRARRREFWVVDFIMAGICSLLSCIPYFLATPMHFQLITIANGSASLSTTGNTALSLMVVFSGIVSFVFFLCRISLTVRRFHDAGLPGWVYPICLVGYCLCGIGAIAELVICLLPSKEDNQYGPNPKENGLNEYEGAGSIVGSIVLYVISGILVIVSLVINSMVCGVGNSDLFGGGSLNNKNSDKEVVSVLDDEKEEKTDDIVDEDNTEVVESGDSETASDSASNSDGCVLKINGNPLTVSFDSDCEVSNPDDSYISVSRVYESGDVCTISYTDSGVEIGGKDQLLFFDAYEDDAEYTLVEKKELEPYTFCDKEGFVSYCTYKSNTTGSVVTDLVVWQDVGLGNYVTEEVFTTAPADVSEIINYTYLDLK